MPPDEKALFDITTGLEAKKLSAQSLLHIQSHLASDLEDIEDTFRP
jgi:hypothetical protein